jgi:hypothetical protein
MKQRYRLTGFARFVIFMLFFVPFAYVGLTLTGGESALAEKIKGLKDKIMTPKKEIVVESSDKDCDEIIKLKEKEIELLRARIKKLEIAAQ